MLSYLFCKQCKIIKCEVSLHSVVRALVEGFQFSPQTRQQLEDPRLYTLSIETITRYNHEAFEINRSSLVINCNPMEAIIRHRQITLVFDFVITPIDRSSDFSSFRSSLMLIRSHHRKKTGQFEAFQNDFQTEKQ